MFSADFTALTVQSSANAERGIHWTVEQDVINFTANYPGVSQVNITSATVLSEIGISSTITYIMELEDHFSLTYQSGDESGIVTVGNAVTLIQSKL